MGRVGGVDGCSAIPRIPLSGLYDTQAYARKKAARLADPDYKSSGDGSFQVVTVGESPFRRQPAVARATGRPPIRHVLDFDDCPF